jgi:hypothetical protein
MLFIGWVLDEANQNIQLGRKLLVGLEKPNPRKGPAVLEIMNIGTQK